ncbi:MAG: hypothetical protein EOP77_00315 [Variovorax sp.]|nr:MAG: hypothetical protein EOP77_00315 [Variovorax sp.]
MGRAPEAGNGQRIHIFLPALRFDTGLEFQTRDVLGRKRWCRLPTPETSSEGSGWLATLQAKALLQDRVPSNDAVARATRPGLPGLGPGDFMVRMATIDRHLQARWRPGLKGCRFTPAGLAQPVVLACLSGSHGVRWALVVGWEQCVHRMPDRPKEPVSSACDGLLLLDSQQAAPWGTAYNARFVICDNRWRGLDGEVERCELLGLVELRLR